MTAAKKRRIGEGGKMAKKVLILSSSPNRNGNSDLLAEEFKRGAVEAGNQVEKIFLRDKKVGYCVACQFCKTKGNGVCAIKDDMAEILKKMHEADVIALASPVYFYGINAQMKTILDRTYASWTGLVDKEIYYIVSCADDADTCIDAAVEQFNGWEICLPNPKRCGVVYGKGVGAPGEVKNKPSYKEAYEMGRSV